MFDSQGHAPERDDRALSSGGGSTKAPHVNLRERCEGGGVYMGMFLTSKIQLLLFVQGGGAPLPLRLPGNEIRGGAEPRAMLSLVVSVLVTSLRYFFLGS